MKWLVCLFLTAGIALSNFGSVVCRGDDGNVKIESLWHACCSETGTAHFLIQSTLERDHHEDCADCTDLPLLHDSLAHRYAFRILRAESYIDHSPAVPYIPLYDKTVSVFRRALPEMPTVSEPSAVLSATVLLC